MQQRLPSRLDPPLAFAHRGARAHAPDNTIEAFTLAQRLGATALESDVWVTSDGVAVLDHDGVVGSRLRRTPISRVARADLPDHIPSLDDLFTVCGTDLDLSLDVKDPEAYGAVAESLERCGAEVARVWLNDPVLDHLVEQRQANNPARLVHSTRLAKLTTSPELHAARLQREGIDAMNMHHTDWNGGLVVLFHRFEILAFSWDLQFDHVLETALRRGGDAVFSDHTDVMVDAIAAETGTR